VKPGAGRIMACMLANVDRLSGDGQKIVRAKAEQETEWREKKAKAGK
jgi:hypothetical protein